MAVDYYIIILYFEILTLDLFYQINVCKILSISGFQQQISLFSKDYRSSKHSTYLLSLIFTKKIEEMKTHQFFHEKQTTTDFFFFI